MLYSFEHFSKNNQQIIIPETHWVGKKQLMMYIDQNNLLLTGLHKFWACTMYIVRIN